MITENTELTEEQFNSLERTNKEEEANDWIQVWKPNGLHKKFCKIMYSPSINKLRHTSFTEFYGRGIVD